MTQPLCAVVGVGPGNGAAFARKFSREGYQIALMARNQKYLEDLSAEIDGSRSYPSDVKDIEPLRSTFSAIKSDMGPVDVLIYNAGSGMFVTVDETTISDFEDAWRINTLGLLVSIQAVLPDMRAAHQGNIIVTGATASLRGAAKTTAFAPAKAAQRSLAQSVAKHVGPDGVHVSYVIIDGGVDLPRAREYNPNPAEDSLLKPDDIAETYYHLSQQKRSAWTFEVDLRPYVEKW